MPRLRASRPRPDSPGFPEPKCYPTVYLREISEYSPLDPVGKGETWRPDRRGVACRSGPKSILIPPGRGHPRKHHPACLPMPSRVAGRGPRRETTDPRPTGIFAATLRISRPDDVSGSSSPGISGAGWSYLKYRKWGEPGPGGRINEPEGGGSGPQDRPLRSGKFRTGRARAREFPSRQGRIVTSPGPQCRVNRSDRRTVTNPHAIALASSIRIQKATWLRATRSRLMGVSTATPHPIFRGASVDSTRRMGALRCPCRPISSRQRRRDPRDHSGFRRGPKPANRRPLELGQKGCMDMRTHDLCTSKQTEEPSAFFPIRHGLVRFQVVEPINDAITSTVSRVVDEYLRHSAPSARGAWPAWTVYAPCPRFRSRTGV
jgi:hypothetical protein